jgi:hypothetical protein
MEPISAETWTSCWTHSTMADGFVSWRLDLPGMRVVPELDALIGAVMPPRASQTNGAELPGMAILRWSCETRAR